MNLAALDNSAPNRKSPESVRRGLALEPRSDLALDTNGLNATQ